MMCEHEFICPNCNGNGYLELHAMGPEKCNVCRGKGAVQSMPTNLIANLEKALLNDLYQQLAVAKAELAAEREKRERFQETLIDIQGWHLIGPLMSEQGRQLLMICKEAENALGGKTRAVFMQEFRELNQRAEQAEAQCKRMEDALREISNVTSKCLSHEEMKDKMKKIAKAALEGKE